MSPIQAALRQLESDNTATDYGLALLNNGAIPAVVVRSDDSMTEDQAKVSKEAWLANHGGKKRGGVSFISGTESIETISMDMTQLGFDQLRDLTESRICTAFQVPPIVLGANVGLKHGTLANYEQAIRAFYEGTISPLHNQIDDIINTMLVTDIDKGLIVYFDISRVVAFEGLRSKRNENIRMDYEKGIITRDEARDSLGYDPAVEGGSDYSTSSSQSVTVNQSKGCGHNHQTKADPDPLSQLDEAIGRRNNAESLMDDVEKDAKKEFKKESKEVMKSFKAINGKKGFKEINQQEFNAMKNAINELEGEWALRIEKGAAESLSAIAISAGEEAAAVLGTSFNISSAEALEFIKTYKFKFAASISSTSADDVRSIVIKAQEGNLSFPEMRDSLLVKFEEWTVPRANMVARTETVRAANQGSIEAYRQAGIKTMEWKSVDDACDWCLEMNGRKTMIGEPFFEQGDTFIVNVKDPSTGDEVPKIMKLNYETVEGPTLHPNCRCVVVPIFEEI
jgi:hypothetical protein